MASGPHARLALLVGALTCACSVGRAHAPQLPTAEERCRASGGVAQPLVADWGAAERAQLESMASRGAIAVVYTGCELRLLPGCNPLGRYQWRRTTLSTDSYGFHDAEELGARLPLSAVSLRAELEQRGGLQLTTSVIGQVELQDYQPATLGMNPACLEATHLVRSISIGASELSSLGAVGMSGGAQASLGALSASRQSQEMVLRRAGLLASCVNAPPDTLPADCSAPIQLFLEPIARADRPQIAGAPVNVRFVSQDSEVTWDVMADGRVLCATPCEQVVDPRRALLLRADGEMLQREQRLEVPDLLQYGDADHLTVRARPRRTGELTTGITLTSLGGTATLTGITLGAVGYGTGDGAMTRAGNITFVASVPVVAAGLWLLIDSMAKVQVLDAHGGAAAQVRVSQ